PADVGAPFFNSAAAPPGATPPAAAKRYRYVTVDTRALRAAIGTVTATATVHIGLFDDAVADFTTARIEDRSNGFSWMADRTVPGGGVDASALVTVTYPDGGRTVTSTAVEADFYIGPRQYQVVPSA